MNLGQLAGPQAANQGLGAKDLAPTNDAPTSCFWLCLP